MTCVHLVETLTGHRIFHTTVNDIDDNECSILGTTLVIETTH